MYEIQMVIKMIIFHYSVQWETALRSLETLASGVCEIQSHPQSGSVWQETANDHGICVMEEPLQEASDTQDIFDPTAGISRIQHARSRD